MGRKMPSDRINKATIGAAVYCLFPTSVNGSRVFPQNLQDRVVQDIQAFLRDRRRVIKVLNLFGKNALDLMLGQVSRKPLLIGYRTQHYRIDPQDAL